MSTVRCNINGINELDLNLIGTVTATTAAGVTTITQTGSGGGPSLEVNGTPNLDQALLNLQNGFGIAVIDNGSGNVSIASVTHDEPLTDGNGNFIFAATLTTGGDIIVVIGIPD
jgi:hypothetical protein